MPRLSKGAAAVIAGVLQVAGHVRCSILGLQATTASKTKFASKTKLMVAGAVAYRNHQAVFKT